jgi:CRP-like cAMP-binding protein
MVASETRTARTLLGRLKAHIPEHAPLTGPEVAVLKKLQSAVRHVRRGSDIIVQGRKYDGIFIVIDGFGLRYKIMSDGKRQVFNISLPGDMVGYPACFFDQALYSVTALTKVTACTITFSDMAEMFGSFPRLAMALFWSTANETAMFGEHLTDVGRRNAYERVAHFVLEMSARLSEIGMGDGRTFIMPLSQAKIADVVGLSVPHINRMLRRLRDERLIEMKGSQIQIIDYDSLAALADFDSSYLCHSSLGRVALNFARNDAIAVSGTSVIETTYQRPIKLDREMDRRRAVGAR